MVPSILNTNITGIVFPLIVDHGGNVLVFCFCLNDTDKLQTDKKSVVGTAMISHGGISGPLSYGKIPTFGWASAIRETQILSISLPAHLTELLVNDVARFRFRLLPLTGCLCCLLATLFFCDRTRSGSLFFRLFDQTFLLCIVSICNVLFLRVSRHHKRNRLIVPVTIGLHEPFA